MDVAAKKVIDNWFIEGYEFVQVWEDCPTYYIVVRVRDTTTYARVFLLGDSWHISIDKEETSLRN